MDFRPQFFSFGWIIGFRHAPGQFSQLFAGQLALARQRLDSFDDGGGGHAESIARDLSCARIF
jgi:hypothetical protein